MDPRKKEIEILEGEASRLEQQITLECVEIGRRVAALDTAGARNEELLKYLNSIGSLRRSMDAFRGDIDRIRALVAQVEARTKEVEENNSRRAEIAREREAKFVEIGAGSFTLFKGLADREPYRAVFEEVMKFDLEIDHKQDELKGIQSEEEKKGFFERLKGDIHKVLVRGQVSRLERNKTSAYAAAGEKIVATDFARFTEGPLRRLFDFDAERRRAADSLAAESERKTREIESLRKELQRLEVQDRPDDKIHEIERRVEAMNKELDVMHCWTGQLYLERDLRREVADSNLSAKYEIVSGIRESIRKKRQQIHRLKALMEIEEITRKEKDRRARRRSLEEEMRVKERQIGVLDIEINMGLRRLEELRRVLTGEAPYQEAPPLPPTPDLYPPASPPPSEDKSIA
jgi:hypothetical protein